jgi:hypothetical protein
MRTRSTDLVNLRQLRNKYPLILSRQKTFVYFVSFVFNIFYKSSRYAP